jgi:putative Ca2+/H+ antiporter (TMEM165/GDT1 family)
MDLSFGYVALLAFWTVLVAELVGDRSLYVVASISLRLRPIVVLATMAAAFAAKSFVTVLLAQFIARLNSHWTDALSAGAFFISALFIWFKEPEPMIKPRSPDPATWRVAIVCFLTLFFMEWGDPGQIALAALTIKSHLALASWLGGALAMITKGSLAILLGLKLRDRLPMRMLRGVASASCCALGVIAVGELIVR